MGSTTTTTASYCDLPLEVIEEIINAVEDDIPTLQTSSQVCSSLLPLCRKYIFRSIDHSPLSPLVAIQSFARLLDNNPGLSYYIQNLSYTLTLPTLTFCGCWGGFGIFDCPDGWLTIGTFVPSPVFLSIADAYYPTTPIFQICKY